MKKISAIILALCIAFALAACSAQSGKTTADDQTTKSTAEAQDTEQQDPAESHDTNTSAPEETAPDTEDDSIPAEETGSKVLVAYFSCTGNTEGIAGYIVDILGADIYEIVPEEPYTDADLNYNDSSSRTTTEQNDDSCRPAISDSVGNMDDYDIVFLGYPIWWGEAPKIMYTFVESYDLSGKTIVPFCTSGSSGVGSSASNLHASASDSVNWIDGTRFGAGASESDIEEWINGLGLDISVN